MDNLFLAETDQLNDKIQIVIRQTDYTEEKAREKLREFNFDEIMVIRDYFGITEKKQQRQVKSLNQEIYKQLRGHMDVAMKSYRDRLDKGEAKKII
jgi:ribosomal silencing factor RsfS